MGNKSLDLSPWQSARKKRMTPERSGSSRFESEDGSWEQTRFLAVEEIDEEVTPSPSMRKIFTRLQERRFWTPGGRTCGS